MQDRPTLNVAIVNEAIQNVRNEKAVKPTTKVFSGKFSLNSDWTTIRNSRPDSH